MILGSNHQRDLHEIALALITAVREHGINITYEGGGARNGDCYAQYVKFTPFDDGGYGCRNYFRLFDEYVIITTVFADKELAPPVQYSYADPDMVEKVIERLQTRYIHP